ncbi:MAG: PD40 domain-containing protein [Candidatus Kapabacteria bacterium]|nr:PD40 domain-containing protein [Candidatus Kapabacteria bacterium]
MKPQSIILSIFILAFACDAKSQQDQQAPRLSSSVSHAIPLWMCNTSEAEYAPSFDPRMKFLVFTSEREGTARIYRTSILTDSTSVLFPGTFNAKGEQRAFISFTTTGEAFGVAYNAYEEQSYPGIVSATRETGSINLGHPISVVNGPFFVSHPTISPDGTRLVYSSTRQGGEGGLDLWISDRRVDLTWSSPVNLGRTINSTDEEISPTFITTDTLLFSSNGFGGKGGYDLFYSVFRNGAWQEPVPLDWLNSEFDESDCIVLPDGSQVFASNRPGGPGGLDLWIAQRISGGE